MKHYKNQPIPETLSARRDQALRNASMGAGSREHYRQPLVKRSGANPESTGSFLRDAMLLGAAATLATLALIPREHNNPPTDAELIHRGWTEENVTAFRNWQQEQGVVFIDPGNEHPPESSP